MSIQISQIRQSLSSLIGENRVLGGILLIAGSSIGVGMLALPMLTGFAGLLPTLCIFLFCWFLMTTTALLLGEAHSYLPEKPNFISLSSKLLGKPGKVVTSTSFLLLFYSLVVAYIVKGGEIVQNALTLLVPFALPDWTGAFILTTLSFSLVYFGIGITDRFNRLSMAGLFIAYLFLLMFGIEHSNVDLLKESDWSYSLFILPFIVTSFGFHNMIPTLNDYLGGNQKTLRTTLLIGSLIPFVVFLLWIIKVQSIVPLQGELGLAAGFKRGAISTEVLADYLHSSSVGLVASYFAFFAIITSLFGQALSIFDFLKGGLKVREGASGRLLLSLLTFGPAFLFAELFPNLFFFILEFVGGVLAMILFGLLPVLMVWVGRYRMNLARAPLVRGGKPLLLLLGLLSSSIILYWVYLRL